AEYAKHRRATSIDCTAVLKWVVTDGANGQSNLAKPATYIEPLPLASKAGGQSKPKKMPSASWTVAPTRAILCTSRQFAAQPKKENDNVEVRHQESHPQASPIV